MKKKHSIAVKDLKARKDVKGGGSSKPTTHGSAPSTHGSAPSTHGSAPSTHGSAPSTHGIAPSSVVLGT